MRLPFCCFFRPFFIFSSSTSSGEVDSKELYKVVAGMLPGDFEVRVHTSQVRYVYTRYHTGYMFSLRCFSVFVKLLF